MEKFGVFTTNRFETLMVRINAHMKGMKVSEVREMSWLDKMEAGFANVVEPRTLVVLEGSKDQFNAVVKASGFTRLW